MEEEMDANAKKQIEADKKAKTFNEMINERWGDWMNAVFPCVY